MRIFMGLDALNRIYLTMCLLFLLNKVGLYNDGQHRQYL